ncbi:primosomal protein N' [Solicola sp. PLA-1-18]|uniref:primosomal protein N' n=1 Tax=Solicola sp. PLA-1-18 TaxID=3380532 RepID=UPI003B797D7E
MSTSDVPEQLALLRTRVRPTKAAVTGTAAHLPVARVAVDVPLAHLDRPFDYLVPEAMDEAAQPGCRVTVRFAGRQVAGLVLERVDASAHEGRLGSLARAVSPEVVLRPDVARLVRQVADRYAGTFSDVVRLAVPPRHARVEAREPKPSAAGPLPEVPVSFAEPEGRRWAASLAAGEPVRAVWSAPPTADVPRTLAASVLAVLRQGRGAVVVVPDTHDVARLDAAFTDVLGPGHHVVLTADLGPSARYAAFLKLSRGQVRAVVGTRAAAFAPVHDLGLVAIWDDGDDLHAEPRAPYPHAREVLLTRAADAGCAALLAAHARTCEAQHLVDTGWAGSIELDPAARRTAWARGQVGGSDDRAMARDAAAQAARLPVDALQVVRAGLRQGPVLVQVPRAGYRTALACQRCHEPARCQRCHGPLAQPGHDADPVCRWCGTVAEHWRCAECGGGQLRAPVVGRGRTAEELGRAFPSVPVVGASGETREARVDGTPRLVVATPGAEPHAEGGYAAALLMDTWLLLARADLRTAEESVRRWLNAAALVRPAGDGGRVVLVGDPANPALQAVVRADPVGFARRELADRRLAHFPPAVRLASIEAPADQLEPLLEREWPQPCELLGPVALPEQRGEDAGARLVVRVPRHRGGALVDALRELQAARSLRKEPTLRIRLDPVSLPF